MAFGRYPSFFATSSMRFLVAGAMYRASGALFSTMETVAGEKPLACATSRIVIVRFLLLGRFTAMGSSADIIILLESPKMQCRWWNGRLHSAGTSNDSGSRNHRVFHTPNAMPAAIQIDPTIIAGRLRFSHSARQMKNPRTGGIKLVSFFSFAR